MIWWLPTCSGCIFRSSGPPVGLQRLRTLQPRCSKRSEATSRQRRKEFPIVSKPRCETGNMPQHANITNPKTNRNSGLNLTRQPSTTPRTFPRSCSKRLGFSAMVDSSVNLSGSGRLRRRGSNLHCATWRTRFCGRTCSRLEACVGNPTATPAVSGRSIVEGRGNSMCSFGYVAVTLHCKALLSPTVVSSHTQLPG